MTVDLQGVTELSPSILFLRGFILEHIHSQLAKKNKASADITSMQIKQKSD